MPPKIDLDVAAAAAKFNLDPALIQAVVIAEGNILKAVQCSVPSVKTREEALKVVCRSAVGALIRFVKSDLHDTEFENLDLDEAFVKHWAKRWAPVGAENDPTALNKNWPKNVLKAWRALNGK